MTLEECRKAARADANKYNTAVAIYHDPPGREDWESEEEAYSFCADDEKAIQILFGPGLKAGLTKRIERIENTNENT